MDINSINLPTPTASDSKFDDKRNDLKMTQETYFKILTTQFKYQDPTQPMRPEAIAEQMMSMGQVEQMIDLNEQMAKLTALQEETKLNNAVNFIGKSIVDDGATKELTVNEASGKPNPVAFTFQADNMKAGLQAVIYDQRGHIVKHDPKGIVANPGVNYYDWDGYDDQGNKAQAGIYTLKISSTRNFSSMTDISTVGSGVDFKFDANEEHGVSNLKVKDASGRVIHRGHLNVIKGTNRYHWDGMVDNEHGQKVAVSKGRYHLEVETADKAGIKTKVSKLVTGIIPQGASGKIEIIMDDGSTKMLSEIDNLYQTELFAEDTTEAPANNLAANNNVQTPPAQQNTTTNFNGNSLMKALADAVKEES